MTRNDLNILAESTKRAEGAAIAAHSADASLHSVARAIVTRLTSEIPQLTTEVPPCAGCNKPLGKTAGDEFGRPAPNDHKRVTNQFGWSNGNPIKTIVASLEGIRVEIYPDRAVRSVWFYNDGEFKEQRMIRFPFGDLVMLELVAGMNLHDSIEVRTAIQEVLRGR